MIKKHYVNKKVLRDEIRRCKEKFESHMAELDNPDRDTTEKVAVKYCSLELYKMMDLIVHGIASKGNFRYYSAIEDFIDTALIVLMTRWYKFNLDGRSKAPTNKKGKPLKDEDGNIIKGDLYSPLAYYTQIIWNSFRTSIKAEAKQKQIKEAILESRGQLASWSTQVDHDNENRLRRLKQSDERKQIESDEENTDHT